MRDLMNLIAENAGKLGFSRAAYLWMVFNGTNEEPLGDVVDVKMDKEGYLAVTVRMRENNKMKVFRFSYVGED